MIDRCRTTDRPVWRDIICLYLQSTHSHTHLVLFFLQQHSAIATSVSIFTEHPVCFESCQKLIAAECGTDMSSLTRLAASPPPVVVSCQKDPVFSLRVSPPILFWQIPLLVTHPCSKLSGHTVHFFLFHWNINTSQSHVTGLTLKKPIDQLHQTGLIGFSLLWFEMLESVFELLWFYIRNWST